jgi:hypothetical protein
LGSLLRRSFARALVRGRIAPASTGVVIIFDTAARDLYPCRAIPPAEQGTTTPRAGSRYFTLAMMSGLVALAG